MLNTVTIMGRLTADPDLGQTPNNISVCKFTVAVVLVVFAHYQF